MGTTLLWRRPSELCSKRALILITQKLPTRPIQALDDLGPFLTDS